MSYVLIAGCCVFVVAFDLSLYSECFVTQRSSVFRLESDSAYPDRGLFKELKIFLKFGAFRVQTHFSQRGFACLKKIKNYRM